MKINTTTSKVLWITLALSTLFTNTYAEAQQFDRETALNTSQSAIGNTVRNAHFTDTQGQPVSLEKYKGKPLIISLIYTSCFHICPTTTQHINSVIKKANDLLGDDSFNIITIGFDTPKDTADAMRVFAKQQSVDINNWAFLSTDQKTITQLSQDIGFLFYPSPHGFDHLIQTSILDNKGTVYRQVYGMDFETPHLIEPLKELIFGRQSNAPLLTHISNRIRLFCTVYDPATGRYRFDYSIFMGLIVGLTLGGLMLFWLVKEWRSRFTDH